MNASEYQKLAMQWQTNDVSDEIDYIINMIKKSFMIDWKDETYAKINLGNLLWYIAKMCDDFGWDMSDIMQMNIDRLNGYYPYGWL